MKYRVSPMRVLSDGLPSVQERIEYIRCVLGYPMEEFAKKLKKSTEEMKGICLGRSLPTLPLLTKISKEFPVIKQEWLLLSSGPVPTPESMHKYFFEGEVSEANRFQTIDVEVLKRIKEIRMDYKLTQLEYASLIGCSEYLIINIERLKASASVALVKRISKQFHAHTDWIIWGKGEKYTRDSPLYKKQRNREAALA